MRDPNRIPRLLDAVRRIWEASPDLRLGQMLVGAMRPSRPCPQVFYFEDDKLEARLAVYPSSETPVHDADEVVLRLSQTKAVVLMSFLIRFRDQGLLAIKHPAEAKVLDDLAKLIEQFLQSELHDPAWTRTLEFARQAVLDHEADLKVN